MCEGRTHALTALELELVAAGVVIPFTRVAVATAGLALVTQAVLAYGAGPLNDIDLYDIVRRFGPHRTATHSFAGIIVFIAATEAGVLARFAHLPGWPGEALIAAGRVWLWLILAIIISSGLSLVRAFGRKKDKGWQGFGPERDWIALGVAGLMMWSGWGLRQAVMAVAVGMVAHLIGDSFTEEGCMWLYPFSTAKCHLIWPRALRFTQGGTFENSILYPALLVALAYLVLVRSGAQFLPGASALGPLTAF
jgi:membrane-bound metal-dependent hydrolase YbcI (DUF457 family)